MTLIGYLGAISLIYSFFVRNILRSKIFSFVGWILITLYAFYIDANPIIIMGTIFALYNVYCFFWIRIGSGKKLFKILFDATFYGLYSREFINYHKENLVRYYPELDLNEIVRNRDKDLNCCLILHETTPIGIFIYKVVSKEEGVAEIVIDYTDPRYANLIEACFLTRGREYLKDKRRIRKLYTYSYDAEHIRYLKKQGFVPTDEKFKFEIRT